MRLCSQMVHKSIQAKKKEPDFCYQWDIVKPSLALTRAEIKLARGHACRQLLLNRGAREGNRVRV